MTDKLTGKLTRRSVVSLAAAGAAAQLLPTQASAAAATTQLSGIQEIVVSVFEFDHLAVPFVSTGDFTRVALPDAPKEQWTAWKVPAACTRIEQVLLKHNGTPGGEGSIKLVKFHGAPQRVMRSSQRSWDTGGIFDIDVSSTDTVAAYRHLQRHGWTAMGEPVEYREDDIHALQVVAVGPNGFNVAIIQNFPPRTDKPPYRMLSSYGGGTQMVADLDRAIAWYRDILGFKTNRRFDIQGQDEPGYDVIGLPKPYSKTVLRRLTMMGGPALPGHRGAGVELIENKGMYGRDFSEHCVAPNVGILCPRIPVADAGAYARDIQGRGGKLYTQVQPLEMAPYGKVEIFSMRSPEGAILEFYSKA